MLTNQHRERIESIDFIRAVCAIGIITFHFSCHLNENCPVRFLFGFANGEYGNVFVNVFFIVSGAMLYYNNSKIKNYKVFYYKRFKSIFPMFYIAYIPFYLITAIQSRNAFYAGNPLKFLLTLVGEDGYADASFGTVNYYQIGEWFLGAIVILYAIYPLLLKLFNKSVVLTTLLVVALYALVFIPDMFKINKGFNIFSCLISFEIGMVLIKIKDKWFNNTKLFIASFFVTIIILFIKIPFIDDNICIHILAVSLFFVLVFLGEILMKNKFLHWSFSKLGLLSYAIFLLQHKFILFIFKIYNPDNWMLMIAMLVIDIVVTILAAYVLNLVNKKLLSSKFYLSFENKILK